MASVDWQKFKTPAEAKAMFRHCEAEERMKTEHTNKDIDKSRTYLNMNFGRFDKENAYEDLCEAYDEVLQYLDSQPGANKRKDRVTLLGLSIPAPEGMSDEQSAEWFVEVYRILDNGFNDTLLGGTVHFDEVHEYRDPETKELKMSRPAMHAYAIPIEGDKLNAKAVCSRRNMIALNNQIEAMTAERFPGFKFMDGSKKKSRKTMEELKAESDKAEAVVQANEKAAQIIEAARARADKIDGEAAETSWKAEQLLEQARRQKVEAEEEIHSRREALNADIMAFSVERANFTNEKAEWRKKANTALQRETQRVIKATEEQVRKNAEKAIEKYEEAKNAYVTAELTANGVAKGFSIDTAQKYSDAVLEKVEEKCKGFKYQSGRTLWDSVGKFVRWACEEAFKEVQPEIGAERMKAQQPRVERAKKAVEEAERRLPTIKSDDKGKKNEGLSM